MSVARRTIPILFVVLLVGATSPSALSAGNPKVLDDLLRCRSIAANLDRLACFDKASGQLAAAAEQGDVRMVDKAQVAHTRRALFGFSLPSLDLFATRTGAKSGRDDDEIKEISATITGVGGTSDGGYLFTLDDGSRWEQTDGVSLGLTPRSGNAVTIRRGALGSYKMTVEKGPAMKVRRIG